MLKQTSILQYNWFISFPANFHDRSESRYNRFGNDRRRRADEDETVLDSQDISSVTSQDQGEYLCWQNSTLQSYPIYWRMSASSQPV